MPTPSPSSSIVSHSKVKSGDRERNTRHKDKGATGRREHAVKEESLSRATSSVIISEEDVTLDMFSREPWTDVLDEGCMHK